ncbi:hypothetical protein B0H10DRAFT_507607 [Mycena sp. CBHHK59/15]|nr:hypothetical protein B0H10DRAFT_507607 [Mycena sp. CBHHK59/15]
MGLHSGDIPQYSWPVSRKVVQGSQRRLYGPCDLAHVMATPQTSQASPHSKIFVVKQHRTIMACTNCRRRKIRCLTSEQPPINPCARCTKKNFQCEYVAVTHQSLTSSSPSANESPEILPSNLSDTSGVTEPQHASQSQDVDRFFQALDAPYFLHPPTIRCRIRLQALDLRISSLHTIEVKITISSPVIPLLPHGMFLSTKCASLRHPWHIVQVPASPFITLRETRIMTTAVGPIKGFPYVVFVPVCRTDC